MIEYLNLYKFDKLEDGTYEKMQGRLDALAWELSIRTKFGCADISMPFYMPEELYTLEKQRECENARKEYRVRSKELVELIEIIKSSVVCDLKIDGEYLYELWILRIFNIDWLNGNPLLELKLLKNKILENNTINPCFVVATEEKVEQKRKLFGIFTIKKR